jgi:hypothetical protein
MMSSSDSSSESGDDDLGGGGGPEGRTISSSKSDSSESSTDGRCKRRRNVDNVSKAVALEREEIAWGRTFIAVLVFVSSLQLGRKRFGRGSYSSKGRFQSASEAYRGRSYLSRGKGAYVSLDKASQAEELRTDSG